MNHKTSTLRTVDAMEQECYGCTRLEMKTMVERSAAYRFERKTAHVHLAVSMMSDAQEELEMGLKDQARKTLNRAKWVLCNYGEA